MRPKTEHGSGTFSECALIESTFTECTVPEPCSVFGLMMACCEHGQWRIKTKEELRTKYNPKIL